MRVERHNIRTGRAPRFLLLPRSDGPPTRTEIYPDSFLWGLADSVAQIVAVSWWTELQAAWFILTGAVPQMAPVGVRRKNIFTDDGEVVLTQIHLDLFPFVCSRTVHRVHARMRELLTHMQPRRALHVSSLRLFDFVEEHRGESDQTPKWAALMREWNKAVQSDWRYHDRRHFRRDYLRISESLTRPDRIEL